VSVTNIPRTKSFITSRTCGTWYIFTDFLMSDERFFTRQHFFTSIACYIFVLSLKALVLSLKALVLSLKALVLSLKALVLSLKALVLSLSRNSIYGVCIRQMRTTWGFPSFMATQIEHPCCNVGTMFTFVHDYRSVLHNKTFF